MNPDGTLKWKKLSISDDYEGHVISEEGKVFTLDKNGSILSALSQEDGSVIWSRSYSSIYKLIYSNNILYAIGGRSVRAIDISNGNQIWFYQGESSTWGFYYNTAPLITSSGLLLVTANNGLSEAIDLSSGTRVWSHDSKAYSKHGNSSISEIIQIGRAHV